MDATTDILAGPILRRVEPRLVSVWLALRFPATVEIEVFRGQGPAGSLGPAVPRKAPPSSLDVHTVGAGKNLHIVVSVWEPESLTGLDLGQIFSYDILIQADNGETKRLKDLGLLSDRSTAPKWFALGYQQDWLPSFSMVPANVSDLKIVQGSCRGPNKPGRDAMPPIDDLIKGKLTDPKQRPHMLFLTGDQIYADECVAEHLETLQAVSLDLLGTQETIAVEFRATETEPQETVQYPLDATHFPPGRRGHPLCDIAGFTQTSADSHAMGFGEYCALYLANWSNTSWKWNPGAILASRKERFTAYLDNLQTAYRRLDAYASTETGRKREKVLEEMAPYHDAWRLLPKAHRAIDATLSNAERNALWGQGNADDSERFFQWKEFWDIAGDPDLPSIPVGDEQPSDLPAGQNTQQQRNRLARALTPSWFAGVQYFGVHHKVVRTPSGQPLRVEATGDKVYDKVHRVDWLYQDLPRVRRLLANVPTYMMFDDHEISDDWNLTPRWAKKTRANALGRSVIRNGLAAYALFQAWGNDPLAYRAGTNGRKLLDAVTEMFASATPQQPGPDPAATAKLEHLFDIKPLSSTERPTPNDERILWHFRYDGPGFEVIALDTRTWRGFEPQANEQIRSRFDDEATATLLTDEAVRLQIPEQPAVGVNPDGVCFVIAAAPFIGYPVVESVVQPVLNLYDIAKARKPSPPFVRWQRSFSVGRIARDPENWGFVPALFEAVLARLSTRRRVVVLSGDVHYSFALRMAYWRLGADWQPTSATRFVQLTASSFRAQRDDLAPIVAIDLAQQLGALSSTQKRLGWSRGPIGSPQAQVPLVAGQKPFSPHLQLMLGEDPIVVSPSGIPETTVYQRDPEWAWQTELAMDQRPDEDRLSDLHPPSFSKVNQLEMVRSVGDRHYWQAQNAMPRSWHWWTNFTTLEFTTKPDGKLDKVRQRIFGYDPQSTGPDVRPYTSAEVPLDVIENPPEEPTV